MQDYGRRRGVKGSKNTDEICRADLNCLMQFLQKAGDRICGLCLLFFLLFAVLFPFFC